MKHGLLMIVCLVSIYAPLCTAQDKNFIQNLLTQYAPTLPFQAAPDDAPKKTTSRYRSLVKQAEGILLVIVLDLFVSRMLKEYELPQAQELSKRNQELQDYIEKQNAEIRHLREDMVKEITKVADEKIQGDTKVDSVYQRSLELLNDRLDICQKRFETLSDDTMIAINEPTIAVQEFARQLQEMKKEIANARTGNIQIIASDATVKEANIDVLKLLSDRLDAVEEANKKLSKVQSETNKQLASDMYTIHKKLSKSDLKTSNSASQTQT